MSEEPPAKSPTKFDAYEFDAKQNQTISELAAAMKWVAVPLIIIGVIYVVSTIVHLFRAFQSFETFLLALMLALAAVLYLALGFWTNRSSNSFAEVVSTHGSDIGHLMEALDNLRKKYSLLSLFVKIYVVLLTIALIVGLVMGFTSGFANPAG